LIDYPGKVAASGKWPRFHLTTRQTKLGCGTGSARQTLADTMLASN
jgi:hypothetical protein